MLMSEKALSLIFLLILMHSNDVLLQTGNQLKKPTTKGPNVEDLQVQEALRNQSLR